VIEHRLHESVDEYVAETIREGLAHLRRWVFACEQTESRLAVQALRRAYDRNSSNLTVQAALGVALARGLDVQPPRAEGHNYRPATILSNAEREARRLLVRVLQAWPEPAIANELASMALATRDETSLDAAFNALEKLPNTPPTELSVWTARAELAIARGAYVHAIGSAAKAADGGDPSGLRALGVARMLHDDDPAEGAGWYLRGLEVADEAALQRYFEDLASLLLPEEIVQWNRQTQPDRAEWIRGKWEWRASTAGRTIADRLAVNFRRLETAATQYRRMAVYGARPADALVWDSVRLRLPWDDRGLIYIRHGEPDDIVREAGGRLGPGREAWIYFGLNDGGALFEFRRPRDWSDWLLMQPVACDPFLYMYGVGGQAGEAKWRRGDPGNPAAGEDFERGVFDWGMRVSAADPSLANYASWCYSVVRSGHLARELPTIRALEAAHRREAMVLADEALSTETATPRFEHFFQALSSVYTFRADAEKATVAAFLLLPAGKLTPRTLDNGVAYDLRLSLAIEDNAEQNVQRLDTLLSFSAPQRLAEDAHMRTAMQMPVRPILNGTVRITVVNADHPDEGQILIGTKPVPIYPPDVLTMSDLVVAEPGEGTWRRGAVAINPLPGHQIPAGGRFKLFYELYGALAEETLRTRITIAPETDPDLLSRLRAVFGDKRVVELSFDESGQPNPDGTVQVQRTITPSLEPGRYVLEVTVTRPDRSGTVSRRTSILLVEESAGR
jgi:hypothetical protein